VKFENIYTANLFSYNHTDTQKELITAKLRRWRHFRNVNKIEINCCLILKRGKRWRSWLRHCATSRKVAGPIPDGVIGIFHWHNPSGRTMVLVLTRPLTEMSTRNISWGLKATGAYGCQLYYLHVPTVMKSGSHNHQKISRPVQTCTGTAVPLPYFKTDSDLRFRFLGVSSKTICEWWIGQVLESRDGRIIIIFAWRDWGNKYSTVQLLRMINRKIFRGGIC
jgi:hypothetical protein